MEEEGFKDGPATWTSIAFGSKLNRVPIAPLPISSPRVLSFRRDSEAIGVMAGRILRDLNPQSICPPRPTDRAVRPEQFDLANLTLVVRRGACKRSDQHLVVRRPAKSECVQDIALGCEADVRVIEFVF